MALVNIDATRGNEGVCERKLRQSIRRNRKLADADDPKAKLRDGDNPQANWPMAMTPLAGTGRRFGLYLKEMCSKGSPRTVALDLYSNPRPSHLSFEGNGAPQLGQAIACSEIWCLHSLQGFIIGQPVTTLDSANRSQYCPL
jgi:hypothetical protein